MTKTKSALPTAPATSLLDMLEAEIEAPSGGASEAPDHYDIGRTSCRIPRAVLEEVAHLAYENRMSVSLLVNLLLDEYLMGHGRSGYATLAPWYAEYVLRKKPRL